MVAQCLAARNARGRIAEGVVNRFAGYAAGNETLSHVLQAS